MKNITTILLMTVLLLFWLTVIAANNLPLWVSLPICFLIGIIAPVTVNMFYKIFDNDKEY